MTSREQCKQRGQAMPSVVAVVSVIAIVVAMVMFFAGSNNKVAQPQASTAEPTPQPTAADAKATDAGNAAEVDEEPDGEQTAARTPQRERADDTKRDRRDQRQQRQQRRRDRPEPQTGPPDVYVEVYNNTSIDGLAAATAAELQDAGWQVVGVDNWHGDIPASTVYYPAGLESEAQQLAETLGFGRVRGAVAPMKFDRLTVILTPDAA
jgi:cell division protein FtsN